MYNLNTIQNSIEKAIFGSNQSLNFIKTRAGLTIDDCIAVHRNTVIENLVSSLKITYPGIWQLIGEDCAKGAALAYMHQDKHLVDRSKISNFGSEFPAFLKSFASTKDLKYLSDYAELEWLKSVCYSTPSYKIISADELQSVLQGDLNEVKFTFNPSVLFLQSNFPLMDIKEMLDNPEYGNLNLYKTECFVMICRADQYIHSLYLRKEEWSFLKAISDGKSVVESMTCLNEERIEQQLLEIINLMLEKQVITKIHSDSVSIE